MDELNEKITRILNDPGSIQQIMQIAASLGGAAPDSNTEAAQGKPPVIPQPEMLENFTNLLHHAEKQEKKQEALVHALRPYLKPGHQERLERAMQIARLSHLAGAAIRSGKIFPSDDGGGDLHV